MTTLMLSVFFDTLAHRNAAATALHTYFAGHPVPGALDDYGISGPTADNPTAQPQLWATLDFDPGVYTARRDAIVNVIQANAVTYGVTNIGVNGHLL